MDALVENSELLQVIVGLLIAVVSGFWGMTKWIEERKTARRQNVEERRITREHEASIAALRLEQQKVEEIHRREDRAADLVLALGAAKDPTARLWTATALALYPDESLRLLINALGHTDRETSAAINLALASIGPQAMTELCRMNRVAQNIVATNSFRSEQSHGRARQSRDAPVSAAVTLDDGNTVAGISPAETPSPPSNQKLESADVIGAHRILACTRSVIGYLILQCEVDELCNMDLADVDLRGMNFNRARLDKASFRKALLNNAVLAGAKLHKANFRGANLSGAILTRANANSSDFTGVQGPLVAIGMNGNSCQFQDAKLEHSNFDGARLQGASFLRTDMASSSLAGVDLAHATIVSSKWHRIMAPKNSMVQATVERLQISGANVKEAKWHRADFNTCRLTGIQATGLGAEHAKFVDCDFGGADLTRARLSGSTFVRCVLSGVSLSGANLKGCTFDSCRFISTSFDGAEMDGARFTGRNEFDAEKLNIGSARWQNAVFEDGSSQLRAVFERASVTELAASQGP